MPAVPALGVARLQTCALVQEEASRDGGPRLSDRTTNSTLSGGSRDERFARDAALVDSRRATFSERQTWPKSRL